MIKKEKDIIKNFRDKYHINVTFEPVWLGNSMLDSISEELYYKVNGVNKVDYSVINSLKNIIINYPDHPIFYNYLYIAYQKNKKFEAGAEIQDKINNKFPDYIFGVTQKATILIQNNLIDEAKEWIGVEIDINKRFSKDKYHYSEVKSYYSVFFILALKEKKIAEARDLLRILWELVPDEKELHSFARDYHVTNFSMLDSFEYDYTYIHKQTRDPIDIDEQAYDTEIYDIILNEDIYEEPSQILKYKPDYLCNELHKICVSGYRNFETVDGDFYSVPIVAFGILSTLNYQQSFPLFIAYISQDKEFVDYFWDEEEERTIGIAFNFAKNDPNPLLELLLKDDVLDYVKEQIFKALVQVSLHGYLPMETLKATYQQLLDKYLYNLKEDLFVPSYLLTMMVAEATALNDIALIEKASPFFHSNKINTLYFGSFEDHLQELKTWELQYAKEYYPRDLDDYLSFDYLKLNKNKPLTDKKKELYPDKDDKFLLFLTDVLVKTISQG
ncbi:MAG: hypothetical protein WBO36_06190, partial [Saprospiraceae bacterium]